MPIQLGNTNITKAYLGSTEVTKAYLGSTLVFAGSTAVIPLANIISEYKFENNTLDTVGTNDGTPTDITYTAGLVGQTGVFNGSTSYVDCGGSSTFDTENPFSISLLVNFSDLSDKQFLVAKEGTLLKRQFQFRKDADNVVKFVLIQGGVIRVDTSIISFNTSQWYHLTATYDNSGVPTGMKIYLDGVDNSSAYTGTTNTGVSNGDNPFVIGMNFRSTDSFAKGSIDCVRFWNKELTPTEVSDIATAELVGTDINP
jgi:hypothetical protein